MELPRNAFKHALAEGRQQIGLWCSLSHHYSLEAVAGSGFDWLLLDTSTRRTTSNRWCRSCRRSRRIPARR